MEQVEMIEKLREKADVTYDEAKVILEGTNWNLLDALVALEKEGKLKEAQHMSYTTRQENTNNYYDTTPPAGETVGEVFKKVINWCGKMILKGMDNKFLIQSKRGRHFEIPVTLLIIFMIPAFWLIIAGLIFAFFTGCKFRFTGPDLGTDKVNNVMDKIEFTHSCDSCNSCKENENYNVNDKK